MFAERVGLEPDEALSSEAVMERLVLVGCDGLSPASVRTLWTNLRALARSIQRYPQPAPVPLARERAKRPYSDADIEGYRRLAAARNTYARRMRCQALVVRGRALDRRRPQAGAAQRLRRAVRRAVCRRLAAPARARTAEIHLACGVR